MKLRKWVSRNGKWELSTKIGVLYYYYYVFIELLKEKREQVRFRQRP